MNLIPDFTTTRNHNDKQRCSHRRFRLLPGRDNGDFPRILKGSVQTIRPTSVQVKLTFSQYTNDVWVDLEYCYKTAQDLVKGLYIHLMQEAYIVDNPDKEPR